MEHKRLLIPEKKLQFERRILQLKLPLTVEKLELMACKSCRVAKPEKLPRFTFSHSLLSLVVDTQPGSREENGNKHFDRVLPPHAFKTVSN